MYVGEMCVEEEVYGCVANATMWKESWLCKEVLSSYMKNIWRMCRDCNCENKCNYI